MLHMDIRIEQAMPKRTCKRGIELKALELLCSISQPISGHASSWANFQHRIAEFYIPQRPWKNLIPYLPLPMTQSAVPSVQSIHIAALPPQSVDIEEPYGHPSDIFCWEISWFFQIG